MTAVSEAEQAAVRMAEPKEVEVRVVMRMVAEMEVALWVEVRQVGAAVVEEKLVVMVRAQVATVEALQARVRVVACVVRAKLVGQMGA